AIAFQVLAGTAAFLFSKWPRAATVIGAGGAALGCLVGLTPTLRVLRGGMPESLRLSWDASHGAFCVEVDGLSAFFLLPVLGLSALAAVYGGCYLLHYRHEKSLGGPWFFFNLFVAGMVMVVIARTTFLFLVAWEVMSVAAYCLVTFEHEKAEVRKAGWVYLVATHLGVAFLFLAFVLLGRSAGSLEFEAFRAMPALGAGWSGLIFVLALVGFGAKAGFVPFHVWLPEAHPAAPSHVSALMSGVMIKMGLYGLLRVLTFLAQPAPWWGLTLAALGLFTAFAGISLALQQRDVKRMLAYSSIENMGLIGLALGVGLWGGASGLAAVAGLGMMAGLLHVWNHALMKGLMFFAAGSVLHGTGTKDMEKLGGLMKTMPWTGGAMMLGAVAIAALPPLNGFVSEWLMYLSLIKCGFASNDRSSLTPLFAVGLLALIGGLAAVAFVRLTGIVLLGSPRSEAARHAHESSPWMLGPMLVLVFLCLTVAVIPHAVAGSMLGVVLAFNARGTTSEGETQAARDAGHALLDLKSSEVPLHIVGHVNTWTFLAVGAVTLLFLARTRRAVRAGGPTWGCGYVKPTERMQYTGRSFAELLAEHVVPRFLRLRTTRHAPCGLFPSPGDFDSAYPDPMSQKVYEPFFRRWAERFSRLRILQQGKIHVYLVYIVLMVVLALAWVSLRRWWATS
ncbi:MAG TPA: proton-conducting transporter membrane subunit, partial [Gemmataceae bacterium]|nr:proton-conducting transporter membrane subunit [Gemmataceae bacterium]